MKYAIVIFTLLISIAMTPARKKTKILFFGDSITQMGANKGGYIDLINEHLVAKNLDEKYELIGAGIGGNKIYDLYLRLEEDVLDKKPDIVFIYVGINDVWHKTSLGTGTDLDKFEKFYVALIHKLQMKKITVILCTPTVIGEKKAKANPQDADLDKYSDVVRSLAKSTRCALVDLRDEFIQYEEANNNDDKESGVLTVDRVHLNAIGNKLVADAMIKALDF